MLCGVMTPLASAMVGAGRYFGPRRNNGFDGREALVQCSVLGRIFCARRVRRVTCDIRGGGVARLDRIRHRAELRAAEQRALDLDLDPKIRVGLDGVWCIRSAARVKSTGDWVYVGRVQAADFLAFGRRVVHRDANAFGTGDGRAVRISK